jgi:hypothetical protein
MTEHQGLPVPGYKPQSDENVNLVKTFKEAEEKILRALDELSNLEAIDKRWLAIGRTDLEKAFMAINRSVFKPSRVVLPEDSQNAEKKDQT